ncbi:unnamed protein product [Peniophora sp. CBMAI 1063]|nr:unnamed protein product [Peniophora sp. CBMAI 1063]
MSSSSSNQPARNDQSRLPEAFSLEELGDWLPSIGVVDEGEPISSLVMAMADSTRDVAQTMGRRTQNDLTAVSWRNVQRPPVPVSRGAVYTPGMTQDWLPQGGRVVIPWQDLDPRPHHNPRIIFRNAEVAQPPAGAYVRRFFGEQYAPQFPRPVTYWPSAPWRALTYGAVGDLERSVVFDHDGDRHRIVGTPDRACLLPGALAAIHLCAREVAALVIGASILLQPLGFRAPDTLAVASGGELLRERSAVSLMSDIDEWRTEIVNLLSFVRLAAEFVPGQAHRLAPPGWMNPVRPEASFAQTLVYWGATEMPTVSFAFDVSAPLHSLPPLSWLASRGVNYRWYWPYSITVPPAIIPAHIAAFNPDASPYHDRRPAPSYLDVLREQHRQNDNTRRSIIHFDQLQQEENERSAREREPYRDLGQLILLRGEARRLFNAAYVPGLQPGRGVIQPWARVDGPPARGQAITSNWIERFRHVRDWPEPGFTTFLGWAHPDGTRVSRQEAEEHVEKQSRSKKRAKAQQAGDEDETDDEVAMDLGGGPVRQAFVIPAEEAPPAWDYLAESPDFVGPRFNFEADLRPLRGDFPSHFAEWRRRPGSIIRLPPPPTSRAAGVVRAGSRERSARPARDKGKGRAPAPPPPQEERECSPLREPSPMGPQDDFNNEEAQARMDVDDELERMQENEAVVDHSMTTARDEAQTRWEVSVREDPSVAGPSRLGRSPSPVHNDGSDVDMTPAPSLPSTARPVTPVQDASPGPVHSRTPRPPPRAPRTMREASSSSDMSLRLGARQMFSGGRPQPYDRRGRSDRKRSLERRNSPSRRSHSPRNRRCTPLPPPQVRSAHCWRHTENISSSSSQRPSVLRSSGRSHARASSTPTPAHVAAATSAPALAARIPSAQAATPCSSVSNTSRWRGQEARIAVVPAGPRRVHTALLSYVPQLPVGRALASSSPQAILQLAWQPYAGQAENVQFVDGIATLIGGGTAGNALADDVVLPISVQGNGSAIRLGVPALLMRRYCQLVHPTMTVREFVLWLLQHGTPFGWAHIAPPAQPEVALPLMFQPLVPTFTEWRGRVEAMLQEKPYTRAFALAGGIGWRSALWVGGSDYAARVAEGPSIRARRHGEELDWWQYYVWDEASGEAFDMLVGRSGSFSLWPPQDIWDNVVGNAVWSPAHEGWFQARLASLQGPTGSSNDRAVADYQWWHEIRRGRRPRERRSIRDHTPATWAAWAERGGLQLTNAPVIIPVSDMPL